MELTEKWVGDRKGGGGDFALDRGRKVGSVIGAGGCAAWYSSELVFLQLVHVLEELPEHSSAAGGHGGEAARDSLKDRRRDTGNRERYGISGRRLHRLSESVHDAAAAEGGDGGRRHGARTPACGGDGGLGRGAEAVAWSPSASWREAATGSHPGGATVFTGTRRGRQRRRTHGFTLCEEHARFRSRNMTDRGHRGVAAGPANKLRLRDETEDAAGRGAQSVETNTG
ncbi:hypothetical protein PR202_ga09304 [Eleusine coracana subsp. coracana]|uniref:Uncharacterized protein n=1 Tax=Eleusine coracana subsp. coracana TaxID=191504 RepID=A0AAV5C276_ELECO|nr:hypothetical protein PR202_ga09304 [Eleusine coracana subsp. coracana]